MFTLKRLVDLVADPAVFGLGLVLLGAVVGAIGRRRHRAVRMVAAGRLLAGLGILALVALSLPAVADGLARPLEERHPALLDPQALTGVQVVAVLGGGHAYRADQAPTTWLNPPGRARLVEGIRVCRLLADCRLIVSGWGGDQAITHAEAAARAAEALGVAPNRLVRLPEPRDTAEELQAIARLVGRDRFVLVTSAIHVPRAMEAARRLGLSPIPAPADYLAGRAGGWRRWIPSAPALARADAALHEYLGRLWYALSGVRS